MFYPLAKHATQYMTDPSILPPGKHPRDQAKCTVPPVDFQLERLQTYLGWAAEHLATFRAKCDADSAEAENELEFLRDSIEKGNEHFERLLERLPHLPSAI